MGELTVFRALQRALTTQKAAVPMINGDALRGWSTMFTSGGELEPGDFQRDAHLPWNRPQSFFAVYACITQIAGDIAKLCLRLMQQDGDIWLETENSAYSPFLRQPNHYQTMQQFVEVWEISKLSKGNTLALLERDKRGVVVRQYVLDWDKLTPLVAPDGSVLYSTSADDLAHLPLGHLAIPASEVIHDRMNCLFHPLVGVSPLYACGLAARQGLEMQQNSAAFFRNMSRPSGILLGPTKINDETADRLKKHWEDNFGNGKVGKVAVLGDNLKYEPMAVTPVDAALVDQLKLSAEQVCAAFGMPKFMIGIGDTPSFDNVQALTQWYYTATLQKYIEAFERLQDQGLALATNLRTEFDLDDLLRMDTKTLAEVEGVKVQRGITAPNEARRKFNLPPATGGDSPMIQQQNYSLEALAKRDSGPDPFKTASPPAPPPVDPAAADAAAGKAAALIVEPVVAEVRSLAAAMARRDAAIEEARAADQRAAEAAASAQAERERAAAEQAATMESLAGAIARRFDASRAVA